MTTLLVGIDVGGSKTALRVIDALTLETVVDEVIATQRWRGESYLDKARILEEMINEHTAGQIAAVAVGAHGCDTPDQCEALREALTDLLQVQIIVVNDAHLLSYAAGHPDAIGVISGTGSIAVGTTAQALSVSAGGWGWLVSDDGGATGLVREAVRASLIASDSGHPDKELERTLLSAAGTERLGDISMMLMLQKPEQWARLAPTVFMAANNGSPVARSVIRKGALSLVDLIDSVIRQGARSTTVVLGGSVIASQPGFAGQVQAEITERFPEINIIIFRDAPVAGAIAIAQSQSSAQISPRHQYSNPLLTTPAAP